MKIDTALLFKSLKYFAYTILLMFSAPVVIYQAFKNQEHPLYIPVLLTGLILGIGAIAMGFVSIRVLMRFVFQSKK